MTQTMEQLEYLVPPNKIGTQSGNPESGVNPWVAFHGIATDRFYDLNNLQPDILVAHPNHEELVAAFDNGETEFICIAVDNNVSGRVTSAIEALRNMQRRMAIVGKITIPVEQHLLVVPGTTLESLEVLHTQEPARVQVADGLLYRPDLRIDTETNEFDCNDTVQGACNVAQGKGIINGRRVAAVASKQAGKAYDLESLGVFSQPGNATTFWIVTNKTSPPLYGTPTHAAIALSVPLGNSLYGGTKIFKEAGVNLSDIDSHLHASSPKTRDYFIEFEYADDSFAAVASRLLLSGYGVRVLGVYPDRTSSDTHAYVEKANGHLPDAIKNVTWNGRKGLGVTDRTSVLYVNGLPGDAAGVGFLSDTLEVFDRNGSNPDLSRPIAAGRGFFFVLEQGIEVAPIMRDLQRIGRQVVDYTYEAGDIVAR